jgi:flavodoxin
MKKLIAYFSRADENYFAGKMKYVEEGNTQKAATIIHEIIPADLLRIQMKVGYAKDYQTCILQAKNDKECDARPELVGLIENLNDYDEIYLGYPNYWSSMPMAVYTFLEHYDFHGKIIHPFCTHEGSGLADTINDIRKTAKGAIVCPGLAIYGSKVDEAYPMIQEWLSAK